MSEKAANDSTADQNSINLSEASLLSSNSHEQNIAKALTSLTKAVNPNDITSSLESANPTNTPGALQFDGRHIY